MIRGWMMVLLAENCQEMAKYDQNMFEKVRNVVEKDTTRSTVHEHGRKREKLSNYGEKKI